MKERIRFLQAHAVPVFIFLNLFTLFLVNCPPWIEAPIERILNARVPRQLAYRARLIAYRVREYAYWTGLDARWEMFSDAKGDDWRYRVEGVDASGKAVPLRLSGQSARGFWDEYLFDFKEGKFRLNTAGSPEGRRAYARYLCKTQVTGNGRRYERVRINILYQHIREQSESLSRGWHFDPEISSHVLEDLKCG